MYLGTLKDQQEAESLLTKALTVLKGAYEWSVDNEKWKLEAVIDETERTITKCKNG